MKQCKNGANCRQSDKYANGVMPISEFYFTKHLGRHYNKCRMCCKIAAAPAINDGVLAQKATVEQLRKYGIPARLGGGFNVEALGCVRIEVKSSTLKEFQSGALGWQFSFYNERRTGWIDADIVVLVALDEDMSPFMYSVFPSNFSKFFSVRHGLIKYGCQVFEEEPTQRKGGYNPLTMDDLEDHENAWVLVENIRQRIGEKLKRDGVYDPPRITKPALRSRSA